jgi:hypothetical protein
MRRRLSLPTTKSFFEFLFAPRRITQRHVDRNFCKARLGAVPTRARRPLASCDFEFLEAGYAPDMNNLE